jgi:lipopolysaccharide/colanic/teichoic acid biosynthesis glycosyltransferase
LGPALQPPSTAPYSEVLLAAPPSDRTPDSITLSPAWRGWQRLAKRALDIVVSATLLVLLMPLLLLIALIIRLDSPGNPLFRQTRLGKNGKPFTFLKFRGMVKDAEAQLADLAHLNEVDGPIFKIKEDPRLTRVGKFLRRSSLDELPQLWNVLCGEMSLIGPRPPIPSEVMVWQVSGRSKLTFEEMVRLDIEYIERWTIWLDLRIAYGTVAAVFSSKGAY